MSRAKRMTRRGFLGLCAAASGTVLVGCQPAPAPSAAPTAAATSAPAATTAPAAAAQPVSFELWTQDWGPLIAIFETSAKNYMAANPGVTVTVKQVPYDDLETKLLPAVAAGTEGDGVFSYQNFWQVVDYTKLLLPLTPAMNKAELEKLVYPAALKSMQGPDGEVYAVPFVAGFDGSYVAVNEAHFDKGYDFQKLSDGTWEELVDVAKGLTQRDASGTMTRAGMNLVNYYWFNVAAGWTLSLGGSVFDEAKKTWTLNTPEGQWAYQELSNLYNVHKVCDLAFVAGMESPFPAGAVSMWEEGAYTISGWNESNPELTITGFPMPRLSKVGQADYKYWGAPMGIITLSRKLKSDAAKLQVGVGLVQEILRPDNLLSLMDVYSGGVPSPGLYESPALLSKKYGPLVKDFGKKIWEHSVFTGNAASPYQTDVFNSEIERMVRGEVTVAELLPKLEEVANTQETEAQQRKGAS